MNRSFQIIPILFGCLMLLPSLGRGQAGFQIPTQRLQQLRPENPAAYRDLAEELALVKSSSTARDLVVRLNLIAAFHGTGKIRRSAIRGLIHAARNENELQRFRVLAFLTDPEFADQIRAGQSGPSADEPKGGDSSLKAKPKTGYSSPSDANQRLLSALMAVRQGKSLKARKIMESKEVQALFGRFQDVMSVKEFNQICLLPEVPDEALLKILLIDGQLRNLSSRAKEDPDSLFEWKQLFREKLPQRIPKISLETVTEFDPTQSIYRNGIWQKPPRN